MRNKIKKSLYWSPRLISIVFLLFLAMFSLDVFESCNNFFGCALALFMHNLPVIILAVLLGISWKREIIMTYAFGIGGILYIIQMIFNSVRYGFEFYMISYSLIIVVPAFVIAYLFYLNWKVRKK